MNATRGKQPNHEKEKKVIVQYGCYNCKSSRGPLYKCTNGTDYVCANCLQLVGNEGPDIGNQSKRVYDKTK